MIIHNASKYHPAAFARRTALRRQRSKDHVAISNPPARQQAIRIGTRTPLSPSLFRVMPESCVAPAYAHRFRRHTLDNENASRDVMGNDTVKCPGCRGTALQRHFFGDVRVLGDLRCKRVRCQKSNQSTSNDIVLISTGHRFTFSEVFGPSYTAATFSPRCTADRARH